MGGNTQDIVFISSLGTTLRNFILLFQINAIITGLLLTVIVSTSLVTCLLVTYSTKLPSVKRRKRIQMNRMEPDGGSEEYLEHTYYPDKANVPDLLCYDENNSETDDMELALTQNERTSRSRMKRFNIRGSLEKQFMRKNKQTSAC